MRPNRDALSYYLWDTIIWQDRLEESNSKEFTKRLKMKDDRSTL